MTASNPAAELTEARARMRDYLWEWGWHPEGALDPDGAEVHAGYGPHMGQMLHRLPRDGQTDDMKRSIQSMLGDLGALLDLAARLAAGGAATDEGLRAGVEAVTVCPHGPRHYYAGDATCQRCQLPSWVEAAVTTAMADAAPTPTEATTCHCGSPDTQSQNPGPLIVHAPDRCYTDATKEEPKCKCQVIGYTRDPDEPHIPGVYEWEQAEDCPVHPPPAVSRAADTAAEEPRTEAQVANAIRRAYAGKGWDEWTPGESDAAPVYRSCLRIAEQAEAEAGEKS